MKTTVDLAKFCSLNFRHAWTINFVKISPGQTFTLYGNQSDNTLVQLGMGMLPAGFFITPQLCIAWITIG